MKYEEMKKKCSTLDLQILASKSEGKDSNEAGCGDDRNGDNSYKSEDSRNEKKYSQKDMDDAVKKRLTREKRKWQREQQNQTIKNDSRDKKSEESEDKQARREVEEKVFRLELKIACYEADVVRDSVEDVAILAKAYMEADEELEMDNAIEKIVKKYPQFKKGI